MQDITIARQQSTGVREYRLPSSPSFKCNVLRESLSEDSQNIHCAILKRRGSWVISVYLWVCYRTVRDVPLHGGDWWRGGGDASPGQEDQLPTRLIPQRGQTVQSVAPFYCKCSLEISSRSYFRFLIHVLWMRSSQVLRASCRQCQSGNSPGFDPSILRHS
jgi:hypothetical protein